MQNNIEEVKRKIISTLKIKGPSLPVQIAKETQINSLFAGAILSELAKEKIIKISHMKVGGSPLYFLEGQKHLLEKFYTYLPGKEKEAFLLLKEKKILRDKEQEPAIRVALRNLKDFATPFLKDNSILWRFYSVTEEKIKDLENQKPERKQETIPIKEKQSKANSLSLKTTIKTKKQKEKSPFVLQVINFLQNQGIEILEEKDIKKKEFSTIINIDSSLGKIKFLCVAKDKKRITENDLRIVLQKAQSLKMSALIIFPHEINKKAQEYAETCSLLKLKKLE